MTSDRSDRTVRFDQIRPDTPVDAAVRLRAFALSGRPVSLDTMSPEALSELISAIAHDLVAQGKAGDLTDDLIPPVDKLTVMRPKDRAHGDWASLGGETLNLEFVSANPTGPIHIGGTRWAAVGDSMARVLEANGATVVREYYFNDHGEQINRFAKSLVAAAHGEECPADGYKGAYIDEIARRVIDEAKADGVDVLNLPRVDGGVDADGNPLGEGDSQQREEFRKRAVPMMFAEIRESMKNFRVSFDVWFHENSLYEDGEVERAIADLRERGDIYEKDGATWFASTNHGDDKDRVIVKSDGNYAYFAADIAYYRNKRHRESNPADVAIYMLGADHHGYIGRMMAMCAAFGDEPGRNMQILIGQLVNVMKDGKPVRMSKRAGNVVTIDDLVEAVGVDAARYSLARTDYNTPVDIDLDLLASHTNENPVYYVQYAHARACNVDRNAADAGITHEGADLALLDTEADGEVLAALAQWPALLSLAGDLRAPHRVAHYLEDLAATYHKWYTAHRQEPGAGPRRRASEAQRRRAHRHRRRPGPAGRRGTRADVTIAMRRPPDTDPRAAQSHIRHVCRYHQPMPAYGRNVT